MHKFHTLSMNTSDTLTGETYGDWVGGNPQLYTSDKLIGDTYRDWVCGTPRLYTSDTLTGETNGDWVGGTPRLYTSDTLIGETYGTRWPSGTRLDFAIARSRVRLPPVAAGPLVRYRGQWMAAYRATVSSAHANQLPLPGL